MLELLLMAVCKVTETGRRYKLTLQRLVLRVQAASSWSSVILLLSIDTKGNQCQGDIIHSYVHCHAVDMVSVYMSISRAMHKGNVLYTMEYYSAIENKTLSFALA